MCDHLPLTLIEQLVVTLTTGCNRRRQRIIMTDLKRQIKLLHSLSTKSLTIQSCEEAVIQNGVEKAPGILLVDSSLLASRIERGLERAICTRRDQHFAVKVVQKAVKEQGALSVHQERTHWAHFSESHVQSERLVKPAMNTKTTYTLACKLFGFQIPLGIVYGKLSHQLTASDGFQKSKNVHEWSIDLILQPIPVLTNWVLRIISRVSTEGAFNFVPRTYSYNHHEDLKQSLNRGDVEAICRMFSNGSAGSDNLIAPWGNSILQVCPCTEICIFKRLMSDRKQSSDMLSEYLICLICAGCF